MALKKKTESSKKNLICESCGSEFVCIPENVLNCDCAKVELNSAERFYIGLKFKGCLCNSCLITLKTRASALAVDPSKENSGKKLWSTFCILFLSTWLSSQTYAPAAGQVGSTAFYKDSSVFVNWANACVVERAYQNISDKTLGYASVGEEWMAGGKALSNGVISLGDGGSAVCTFNFPIRNGPGFDFAVFENSIDDSFLELAFVEVSSDGFNFFRFKSHSLTDTLVQTGSFGSTEASKINNLAGKYRAGYGTPFDLQELDGLEGLDISNITHIKIVDVIGSLNVLYASRDGYGNRINDPWPTPFPSGGFDLDAIGVIYENGITALAEHKTGGQFEVYPNPVNQGETLFIKTNLKLYSVEIQTLQAITLFQTNAPELPISQLESGVYLLKLTTQIGTEYLKFVVR